MESLASKELKEREEKAEEKLRELLENLFRFDMEDVDFGIYRIMNFKRDEIRKFIENDLIGEVEKEFKGLYEEDRKDIESELEEIKKKIKEDFGEDALDEQGNLNPLFENTKLGRVYKEKREALKNVENVVIDKIEIFSRIYEFFSRYYQNGDLIPIRRYGGENDYIVPYNGEEVYLYWANKDQYYVKTTEYFQKYTFKAGIYDVNFKLREAHIDKNNVKGKDKYFVLCDENFLEVKDRCVNIYFEYRELTNEDYERLELRDRANKKTIKEKLLEDAVERINKELEKTKHPDIKRQLNAKYVKKSGEESEKTKLEMHLLNYVTKNTKDYFIHKNLKKFFMTELDYYIKNEMMPLEDITAMDEAKLRKVMRRVKVFKNLATKIIEFLAEIEEFEKMLWEKKKFVVSTEYVITLDKIAEYAGAEFLESILDTILANERQREEWKELFDVKIRSKNDLFEMKIDGKEWKKLPVDTKYFDEEFKWKLLVVLTKEHELDDILDGVLIKSENWQALNLLREKYKDRVKTIYIDPPYNTGSGDFLFKDNYPHSSWLTMMEDRLNIARLLLNERGVFFSNIDDNEVDNLGVLLKRVFGDTKTDKIIWKKASEGRWGKMKNVKTFRKDHEYIMVAYMKIKEMNKLREKPQFKHEYGNPDNDPRGPYKVGSISRKEEASNPDHPNYYTVISPTGKKFTRQWDFPKEEFERLNKEGRIYWGKDGNSVPGLKIFLNEEREVTPYSILIEKGTNTEAKEEFLDILGKEFESIINKLNPKPHKLIKTLLQISTKDYMYVLDFFAGSGTTAHAVMKLNKEDDGRRKFILVEMADYFDTVIIPRIKKVAYSFNWKDGKPQDVDGIGVFFKYHTLEQYEDTLNNIEFVNEKGRQKTLMGYQDYIFYMLEYGTRGSMSRLNIDKFKTPFNYKMRILENGIEKDVNVDLVETFNYLLGLHISRIYVENANGRKYVWVVGKRNGSTVVVIWRDVENLDLKKDKDYIESNIQAVAGAEPDAIYVNGDSHVEGAMPIEVEFMKIMGA